MSLAEELKTTGIVGTAQKELDVSAANGNLEKTLANLDRADKERFLLSVAAVHAAWQTAGKITPTDKENLPDAAEAEIGKMLSGSLKQFYETLLNASDKSLLPEFSDLMKRHDRLIPPELLPPTFALADTHLQFRGTNFRRQILPVAGNLGRWLARQNVRWRWILIEETSAEMFETGNADERIFALEYLRKKDANKAREILQANWKSESAKERQKFLEVWRTSLSSADEEFLDEILRTDKSAEVRQTAFDLLASLPDSKLIKDSTAQVWQILSFVKGGILRSAKIEINFPADFDKEEFGYFPFPKSKTDLGRKGWKFVQILSAVSLEEIEKRFAVKPLDFVAAVKNNPWTLEIFLGLSMAARRQKNYDWFEALLFGFSEKNNAAAFEGKYQSRNDFTENLRQAIAALPSEKVEAAANYFLTKNELLNDEHPAFYFLKSYEGKWSDELSRNFLQAIKRTFSIKTKRKRDERTWSVLEFLPQSAALIPFHFGAQNVFDADENYQPEAVKKLREFDEILRSRFQINTAFENEE